MLSADVVTVALFSDMAGPQTRRKPEPAYSNRRLGFFFNLARALNDARLSDALSHSIPRFADEHEQPVVDREALDVHAGLEPRQVAQQRLDSVGHHADLFGGQIARSHAANLATVDRARTTWTDRNINGQDLRLSGHRGPITLRPH